MRGTPFFDALMGDARGYDAWAQRIAGGEWIGRDVFYQAPLYPYFLGLVYAVFGRDLLVVRIVQAVIGSLSCVLVCFAANRLFSRHAGIVAGFLMAFYAPAIFFVGLIQKSVLDVFFVSALLALIAVRLKPDATKTAIAMLGIVGGGLALTRENALVIVALLGVWLWFTPGRHHSRLAGVAILAAGVSLVLLPVAIRNYSVTGGFYLTTAQFGPNFYIGNHAGADGTYSSLRFGRGSPEYEQADATELAQQALGRALTPGEVSGYWTERALTFISTQPMAWLRLTGRKIALLVNAREMLDTESQESHAEWSLPLRVLGPVTHFGVLVPLAVLGAWIAWPMRSRLWVLYASALLYSASVVAFYVFARYRYPLIPLLVLFASVTVTEVTQIVMRRGPLWSALRSRSRSQRAAVVFVIALTSIAANWPLLSPDLMRAITETNLGTALVENGRLQDGEARYRRAIEIQSDYAPAYNNLGVALRAQGRLDEAIRTYEDGLRVRREYPTLHANLAKASYDAGTAHLEAGRLNEAVTAFELSLREQPQYAEAHNNLGIAFGSQGKLDAAIAEFEQALKIKPDYVDARKNLETARIAGASLKSKTRPTVF